MSVHEKRFQRGVLQLRDNEPDGTHCFRIFSSDEVYNRDAACSLLTVKRCIRCGGSGPRIKGRMIGERSLTGGEPGGRESCRHRNTCEQLRKEWSREWVSEQEDLEVWLRCPVSMLLEILVLCSC